MPDSPSRRDVLAATGGALAGLAGGYLARPHVSREPPSDPVPLAWADTEWPYPDYDPARTRNPPAASAPSSELSVAWRHAPDAGFARSPPVAANGRVATGGVAERGTTVRSLDAATGETAWRHRHLGDNSLRGLRLLAPGDGVYYRVSEYERGSLGMFAAASGEHAWGVREGLPAGWTIGLGRVYVGTRSTGRVYAIDARTSERLWRVDVDGDRAVVESFHPEHGLFVEGSGVLYAIDPADGSVRWQQQVPTHVESGPVVAGGRAFVSKWMDGMDLLAFDAASGDRLWTLPLSPTEVETDDGMARRWYEVGAATERVAVVRERRADPTAARLLAVDAASGDVRWRVTPPAGATAFSKPTVVDANVYVCVSGDSVTELRRLDLADGSATESWALPARGGGPVVTDGRVLVQTEKELVALE